MARLLADSVEGLVAVVLLLSAALGVTRQGVVGASGARSVGVAGVSSEGVHDDGCVGLFGFGWVCSWLVEGWIELMVDGLMKGEGGSWGEMCTYIMS